MNARSYNLNPESAKQANTSNRITETGKYIGKFTRAEAVTSKQGTEGIEFTFESDDGQSADFLTLWTVNKDGKEIFGFKMVNAIMTCLRTKSISSTEAMIEKFEDGAKKKVSATVYPDLIGKPIGLLLQREEYKKQNGDTGYKFNIYACFDAVTGMTAGEILDRATKAEQLEKIAATLRDKPMQTRSGPNQTSAPPSDFDNFADDIPFDF